MTTSWVNRHPFQWTTSQITFASAGGAPMKTSLKERVQKLQSNAPNAWSLQCDGAKVITGSTLSRALSLGTLKEQQTHYNKVYNGEREVVSPDLQVRFDYGSAKKSPALATTLGKIVPIFYTGETFSEYGCVVLQVREDGSGVTENETDQVCFVFKGPIS